MLQSDPIPSFRLQSAFDRLIKKPERGESYYFKVKPLHGRLITCCRFNESFPVRGSRVPRGRGNKSSHKHFLTGVCEVLNLVLKIFAYFSNLTKGDALLIFRTAAIDVLNAQG